MRSVFSALFAAYAPACVGSLVRASHCAGAWSSAVLGRASGPAQARASAARPPSSRSARGAGGGTRGSSAAEEGNVHDGAHLRGGQIGEEV